tara:strand:- start:3042 stop:3272 length:231 start_codon:yes stop_codon:yes gene_type:complete
MEVLVVIWIVLTVCYLFSVMLCMIGGADVWYVDICNVGFQRIAKHNGTLLLLWLCVIPFGCLFVVAGIIRWCFKEL